MNGGDDLPKRLHRPLLELASRYRDLKRSLNAHQLRIHPSSRIGRFSKCLEDAVQWVDTGNGKFAVDEDLFHQAVIEHDQLALISQELPKFLCPDEVRNRMQRIVDGPALPQDEKKFASSRDFQFELLMASLLSLGGLTVELAEPDILVRLGEEAIGIAVKRPKSRKNFPKCISDASNQIRDSGFEGLIALDLGPIFNPGNGPLNIEGTQDIQRVIMGGLENWIRSNHEKLIDLIKNDHVFGILVFWSTQTLNESTDELGMFEHIVGANFCHDSDRRFSFLTEITRAAHTALHNPVG